jgi:arylsulfatase A-like enzyme
MVNRREFIGLLASILSVPNLAKATRRSKPNILFISLDDMNDWISPLSSSSGLGAGYPGVITPNIDKLSNLGTCFTSAYAPVPACSPSRTSVSLGASADKTGVYYNGQIWFRNALPSAKSIYGYFRQNGWKTIGLGKLFHKEILESDFDIYSKKAEAVDASCNTNLIKSHFKNKLSRKVYYGVPSDECFWAIRDDVLRAKEAARIISQEFRNGGAFLGLGLVATHLPFVAPQKYFDLYPKEKLSTPPGFYPGAKLPSENYPDLSDLPRRARSMAIREYAKKFTNLDSYREFMQAYLATISFTDANIGLLLEEIQRSSLLDKTYIVIWSDHGMSMGEKQAFKKFNLWERALRVPFIIAGPGIRTQKIDTPVSLIDIYPTLCQLLGLEVPAWCNGTDLSETLATGKAPQNSTPISIYGKGAKPRPDDNKLSIKVHTNEWNYIKHGEKQAELYSRKNDPHEWHNLYSTQDQYSDGSELINELESLLPSKMATPVWS